MILRTLLLTTTLSVPALAQTAPTQLANNTVLIVRHAEKPADGAGLTPLGEARAQAYASYFQPFHDGGFSLHISSLYAGADSAKSQRPRLTLEPLSRATGLPLHTDVSTKDPAALVAELAQQPHGATPLIAWRHGAIPALLTAFGVDPQTILPNGRWPDDVFDWVLVLKTDAQGKVVQQTLVREHLHVTAP
jgi:hypothetical protein